MAQRGRVRAQAADPRRPGLVRREHGLEVRGVRAVDHVVGGRPSGGFVDLLDRVAEGLAVRQAAVGFEGERDRGRQSHVPRRLRQADRLVRVGHRDRGDHVRRRVGERPDLRGVVIPCVVCAQDLRGVVAVALRPDAAADDHRRVVRAGRAAQLLHQLDRPTVEGVELLRGHAEAVRPVRTGAPGRALQHKAHTALFRQRKVRLVVAAELIQTLVAVEQDERSKLGQVEALVENEACLDSPIG